MKDPSLLAGEESVCILAAKFMPCDQVLIKSGPSLLREGFEDPEVMQAVQEIGQDPQAMRKYKDKPKVSQPCVDAVRGYACNAPHRLSLFNQLPFLHSFLSWAWLLHQRAFCWHQFLQHFPWTCMQVIAFYSAMGSMMGNKLEGMSQGSKEEDAE